MKQVQLKRSKSFFTLLLFSVLFIACDNDKCIDAPNVSDIEISIEIERLDKKLHKIESKASLEKLLFSHATFTNEFLKLQEYPHPGILGDRFYNLMNDPGIDSLFIEVDRTFGDLEDIRHQFEEAFRYLKYYFPSAKIPKIQTVVTGIANDLYLSDSLIIIGLDYYLGAQGKYQPLDIPGYILKRYQKEYMVPQIMLMYANFFNATDYEDKSALADMIYYGKAYHMAKNLMPCTPDSLFTGYTAFETRDITEHEQVIWASMLENEVLFEKSPYIKDKFLSERPQTIEIGENCPGRIGRWIGWRIVEKYAAQNPEISLPMLMQEQDAQKIFNESKYKPIPY
ncbi:MAG: gliding motility lipoprotein GldB [Cyclobacteriaceae bacterium]|nr:gliding motility lipoprotein GldB [Cyclobacteriaceae bacterium]